MLFLYCKEMKLFMSYNICPIDIYLYLTYNCEKIKTKITVLLSLFFIIFTCQNFSCFMNFIMFRVLGGFPHYSQSLR